MYVKTHPMSVIFGQDRLQSSYFIFLMMWRYAQHVCAYNSLSHSTWSKQGKIVDSERWGFIRDVYISCLFCQYTSAIVYWSRALGKCISVPRPPVNYREPAYPAKKNNLPHPNPFRFIKIYLKSKYTYLCCFFRCICTCNWKL